MWVREMGTEKCWGKLMKTRPLRKYSVRACDRTVRVSVAVCMRVVVTDFEGERVTERVIERVAVLVCGSVSHMRVSWG